MQVTRPHAGTSWVGAYVPIVTGLVGAAMACLFEAIESGDRRWFIAGGIVTGLCWNTKYNGFFPLPITGLWLLLSVVARPSGNIAERLRALPLRGFGLAAGIATLF